MDAILTTVLPVFGLIVLGFAFARLRIVDQATAKGLTQFVFTLAIPALLFRTVALTKPQEATPFGLWIAFFGGLALTWIITGLIASKFENLSERQSDELATFVRSKNRGEKDSFIYKNAREQFEMRVHKRLISVGKGIGPRTFAS